MDRNEIIVEIQRRIATHGIVTQCDRNPSRGSTHKTYPYAAIHEHDDLADGYATRNSTATRMGLDVTVELFFIPPDNPNKGSTEIVWNAKRVKNIILYNTNEIDISDGMTPEQPNLGGKCAEIRHKGRSKILSVIDEDGNTLNGIGLWFHIKYIET